MTLLIYLRRERLVDLKHIDVLEAEAREPDRLGDGDGWADPHDRRVAADLGVTRVTMRVTTERVMSNELLTSLLSIKASVIDEWMCL